MTKPPSAPVAAAIFIILLSVLGLSCSGGDHNPTGPTAVASVAVAPAVDTAVALGDTVRFHATALDDAGHAIANAKVDWSTSSTSTASIDTLGLATGLTAGTVTVTALCGGQSGSGRLVVQGQTEMARGSVTLPSGSPIRVGSLLANSEQTSAAVRASGAFDVAVPVDSFPRLILFSDSSGNPLFAAVRLPSDTGRLSVTTANMAAGLVMAHPALTDASASDLQRLSGVLTAQPSFAALVSRLNALLVNGSAVADDSLAWALVADVIQTAAAALGTAPVERVAAWNALDPILARDASGVWYVTNPRPLYIGVEFTDPRSGGVEWHIMRPASYSGWLAVNRVPVRTDFGSVAQGPYDVVFTLGLFTEDFTRRVNLAALGLNFVVQWVVTAGRAFVPSLAAIGGLEQCASDLLLGDLTIATMVKTLANDYEAGRLRAFDVAFDVLMAAKSCYGIKSGARLEMAFRFLKGALRLKDQMEAAYQSGQVFAATFIPFTANRVALLEGSNPAPGITTGGAAFLTSTPPGASASMVGHTGGPTPWAFLGLPAGQSAYSVSLSGYEDVNGSVTPPSGRWSLVGLQLVPQTVGTPSQVSKVSGDNQTGTVGQPLSSPLVVKVADAGGNPVAGVAVSWAVTAGGGSVNPSSSLTSSAGLAQTTWTLGPVVGTNNNGATATVGGLTGSPVSFTASAFSDLTTGLIGVWRGAGSQVNPTANWSVLVTYVGGAAGAPVAAVAYPSVPCAGTWTLSSSDASAAFLRESISFGSCVTADITTRLTGSDSLYFDLVGVGLPNNTGSASLARVSASGSAVPLQFRGLWIGSGFQYNLSSQWTISLALVDGPTGSIIGSSAYPSVPCGGEILLEGATQSAMQLREHITYGPCVDQGSMTISPSGEGSLSFVWRASSGGPIGSVGALAPQGSSLPSIPAAPSDLAASVGTSQQVRLTWIDNTTTESGFVVERASGSDQFSAVAVVGPNTVSYLDATITSGVQYQYRIRAFNPAGSATSSTTSVQPAPPTVSGVIPDQGPLAGGTAITIIGTGFTAPAAATIGGNAVAGLQVVSSTQLTGTAPAGSSPGFKDVVVTTSAGTATCAGCFTYAAIQMRPEQLDAGAYHTCGITEDGAMQCWGWNGYGQLGTGSMLGPQSCGDGAPCSTLPVAVSGGLTFTAVAAGGWHTCGLASGGVPYCWGDNQYGELGNGTSLPDSTPHAVGGGLTFITLAVGTMHSCGLTGTGLAYCWGVNDVGELGSGSTVWSNTPVAVSGGLVFKALVATDRNTCGLTGSGVAYCWGDNTYGVLGNGSTTGPQQCSYGGQSWACSTVPVPVSGGFTFAALTSNGGHTCGLTGSGVAYCWGANAGGELGNGTITNSSTPVAVNGSLTFSRLAAGTSHTCGVTASGVAYCWGRNADGQLGTGSTDPSVTPVAVSGDLTFTALTAGMAHTCGLTGGGVAYCWGYNGSGDLGNGTTISSSTPVAVTGGLTFRH